MTFLAIGGDDAPDITDERMAPGDGPPLHKHPWSTWEVVVEGRLGEETATVTIDYVPPGPGVKAALLFSHDPAGAEIDVAIRGYTRP